MGIATSHLFMQQPFVLAFLVPGLRMDAGAPGKSQTQPLPSRIHGQRCQMQGGPCRDGGACCRASWACKGGGGQLCFVLLEHPEKRQRSHQQTPQGVWGAASGLLWAEHHVQREQKGGETREGAKPGPQAPCTLCPGL